jgi:hypothetical protein
MKTEFGNPRWRVRLISRLFRRAYPERYPWLVRRRSSWSWLVRLAMVAPPLVLGIYWAFTPRDPAVSSVDQSMACYEGTCHIDTGAAPPNLTVTSTLTATGLVTNADLSNPSTTSKPGHVLTSTGPAPVPVWTDPAYPAGSITLPSLPARSNSSGYYINGVPITPPGCYINGVACSGPIPATVTPPREAQEPQPSGRSAP